MDHLSGNFGNFFPVQEVEAPPSMDRWIYSSCNNTAPTTPWSARYQVLFAAVLAAVKIHVGWFCDLEDMSDMMQCVIDVTGFRFKGTSWSEARIKLSPMDVEYDHLYWPSTFHFWWETMDLSECVGSWKFVVVHYFQEAIWIGSVKEGTSKDWT